MDRHDYDRSGATVIAQIRAMGARSVLFVAMASLLLTAADASAQENRAPATPPPTWRGPAPPPRVETEERWYGYQTLILDGVATILIPVGIAVNLEEDADAFPIKGFTLYGHGGATYLFGAPSVHWAHGRVAAGFGSLGLRLLAPAAGLGLGALASDLATGSRNQVGIPIGIVVGGVAAMVVDAAVLGWEKVPREVSSPRAVLPELVINRQMMMVGVAGGF